MIKLADFFHTELISFLSADSRDGALHTLVEILDKGGKIRDKEIFSQAIIEREKIVSTGIGMGVAIPHAKLPGYEDFFIAIGILQKGVDWNSLDGAPVRLIFMIGGPDDKQTEYLRLLCSLTFALKNEDLRKKILTLNSSEAIMQLLRETF